MSTTVHDGTTEIIDEEREERLRRACRHLRAVTPETVWKVAAKPIYWTPEFLSVLFARTEGLRLIDVESAWTLGEPLPVLAERIPWTGLAMEAERSSWTVRVLALLAELADLAGRPHRADAFLKQAVEVEGADVLAMAELYRRRAACAVRAGNMPEARVCIGNAISRYRSLDASEPEKAEGLAEALFLDGIVHDEPLSLGEALSWMHPGQRGSGVVFDAASTAVAERIGRPMSREQLEGTMAWLDRVRRRSFRGIFQSTQKFRLMWSEARLLVRCGCGRIARKRYETIWGHFISLDDAAALAVCGVDWAIAAVIDGVANKATDVLRRTARHLGFIDADLDLREAVGQARTTLDLKATDLDALAELRQKMASEHLSGPGRWYPLRHLERKTAPSRRRSLTGLTIDPIHE